MKILNKDEIKELIGNSLIDNDKELVINFLYYYCKFEVPGSQSGYGLDISDLDYGALACALRKIILEKTVK